MIHINKKEVNTLAEYNLLHDIINPTKRAKNTDICYYPILHGCMKNRKGRAKFESFRIILDSGCSSTTVMVTMVKKLHSEKYAVMQWHTQAGKITTNIKVKIYLILPALSAPNAMTWNCHVDGSAKGRCDMIIGGYLLKEFGLNFKLSEHVIKADDGLFKGPTTLMVDLGKYIFKI